MFIDSHAHLDLCDMDYSQLFVNDLSSVIHISLNVDEFLQNYPSFSKFHNIHFATGYYPDHSPKFDPTIDIPALREVLTQYPHCALGEIGIDLVKDYGTLSQQTFLFESQIALAEELNLPISIHSRESFDECFNSLKKFKAPAILHCFSYGIPEAEKMLARGDYISFSGILTFPKSKDIQEVAKMVPLDRILFETDSPCLAPVPLRGKQNVPSNVHHTYKYFAQLRQIPLDELCAIAKQNVATAFGL